MPQMRHSANSIKFPCGFVETQTNFDREIKTSSGTENPPTVDTFKVSENYIRIFRLMKSTSRYTSLQVRFKSKF